jgi:hypothetical protein
LFFKNGLGNAFIQSLQQLFEKTKMIHMKKITAVIFAIIGVLLISSVALALDVATAAMPTDSVSNRLMQASWIRLNGNITLWGSTDVSGQLQTQARAAVHETSGDRELTSATAIWTTNTTRAIQAERTKENFTYIYYVARLPNASVATVDTSNGYFLSGTWNLAKVNCTITVNTDENGAITHVNRNQDVTPSTAYGELTVSDNKFTLNINGMDPLTGAVYRSITRSWFNPFKMTDGSTSNIVTRSDVHAIANCYGNMPGWGTYQSNMDFNGNYRVDIADISTVAANT